MHRTALAPATPSKNNLLHHYLWLRAALASSGAEAILSFDSCDLLIRRGPQQWIMHPKFLAVVDGQQQYTSAVAPGITTFAGWLPYRQKHWPLAADKLAFKHYAHEARLPVPEFSTDPASALPTVIVKRAHSSFGAQIRGPFASARDYPLRPAQDEYYERFVEGKILKIWFWEGEPLCLEMDDLPTVRGNGRSTVGDLILQRLSLHQKLGERDQRRVLDAQAEMLRYFGCTTDTVLATGKRQVVEFRYGSNLLHPRGRTVVDLGRTPLAALMPTLRRAGPILRAAIPPELRRHTLFTVDAVLDRQDQLWLLEMNSNPAVHPLAYPAIAASLVGPGAATPG